MTAFTSPVVIHRLLLADALLSGLTGIAMVALGGRVAPLLNIPAPLMRTAGIALLPFAVMVFYFARHVTRSRLGTVVGLNLAWVAASVMMLVARVIEPTTLGTVFVIVQAMIVAVVAELQLLGMRRSLAPA
jgi:hypothetical protein